MVNADDLRQRILAALPDSEVKIHDFTGGGDHYQVEVVSQAFRGMSQIKRHRMVYAPLKDILGGALHALALITRTPDEKP